MTETPSPLALISEADHRLQAATEIVELMDLRAMAKAAEAAAAALGLADVAQHAKVFQLRAERKAGEWLSTHVRRGPLTDKTHSGFISLDQLEIDDHASARWQAIARMPEEKFQGYIDEHLARGWEVTAGGLRSYARNLNGDRPAPSGRLPQGYWLKPPDGVCALAGFRVPCSGRLERHHILNKSKSRGSDEVRAVLASCPPEIMADVCEAHNVDRWADAKDAQRILLLQAVYRFGYSHMSEFLRSLPWKVPQADLTLEALLG